MESRSNVLNTYRNMLRLAKSIQNPSEKTKTVVRIREAFRANKSENNSQTVSDMLSKANSSLSYLKIITPKQSHTRLTTVDASATSTAAPSTPAPSSSGSTRIIFAPEGKIEIKDDSDEVLVNGAKKSAKAYSNWTGNNLDPDSVARHYAGLKRAGFKSNRDVIGPLF